MNQEIDRRFPEIHAVVTNGQAVLVLHEQNVQVIRDAMAPVIEEMEARLKRMEDRTVGVVMTSEDIWGAPKPQRIHIISSAEGAGIAQIDGKRYVEEQRHLTALEGCDMLEKKLRQAIEVIRDKVEWPHSEPQNLAFNTKGRELVAWARENGMLP